MSAHGDEAHNRVVGARWALRLVRDALAAGTSPVAALEVEIHRVEVVNRVAASVEAGKRSRPRVTS